MKSVKEYYSSIIFFAIGIFIYPTALWGQTTCSLPQAATISEFEIKAKAYSKLREGIESQLPKLPKDATAEQIETHKTIFQKAVQAAISNNKQGFIFTPDSAQLIRNIIKKEFTGKERTELKKFLIIEAETKGIPLKVNFPYPEAKEQLEMPPTLLLNLPQLPKQLRYRFVGNNLLLVDRENGLIIDYMINAVP